MKRWTYYCVETFNVNTKERAFTYYEDGHNAQEVVDRVRSYIPDEEKILNVYKQVNSWK